MTAPSADSSGMCCESSGGSMAVAAAAGGDDPRSLRRRVEAALRGLADGRTRLEHSSTAVGELREGLGEVGVRLGVDLREIQESVVEHTAMYAKNPEVLGGMLQLVFCLDLVHGWLEQRDAKAQELERRLGLLEGGVTDCEALFVGLRGEVRACSHRLTELQEVQLACKELPLYAGLQVAWGDAGASSLSTVGATNVDSAKERAAESPAERALRREAAALRAQLQAAVAGAEKAKAAAAAAAASAAGVRTSAGLPARGGLQLQQRRGTQRPPEGVPSGAPEPGWAADEALRRENAELRARLSEVDPTAAAAAAAAAEPPLGTMPPVQGLLAGLERLEPLLASLPVALVPGMAELQEEACEAYGRLRSVLLDAAAVPGSAATAMLPGQSGARLGYPWPCQFSGGGDAWGPQASPPLRHSPPSAAAAPSWCISAPPAVLAASPVSGRVLPGGAPGGAPLWAGSPLQLGQGVLRPLHQEPVARLSSEAVSLASSAPQLVTAAAAIGRLEPLAGCGGASAGIGLVRLGTAPSPYALGAVPAAASSAPPTACFGQGLSGQGGGGVPSANRLM